ncbi:MAG: nucleotide exchange factor GrpE [Ardenticatenaceae bacterium]|nr:nucleotide exchange factor GrpE [Ardenticatenaceae bacterium]
MSKKINVEEKDQVEPEDVEAVEMEGSGEETAVSEPEAEPTLEEQLAAAQAEAAKNLDGWMRTQAEFANARKRMEKQRAETYQNASADVVTKLLPILDDFERALSTVPSEIAEISWLEGIQLVQRKLLGILEGLNVKTIEAVGQHFDPVFHEAIMQEPSDEYDSGVVSKELQKGYQLGDRVIRPSLVYVAE